MTRAELRKLTLERDGYLCQYCLGPASTVDHVVPLARDGDWQEKNLVAACWPCNQRKDDLSLEVFLLRDAKAFLLRGEGVGHVYARVMHALHGEAAILPRVFRVLIRDGHRCQFCLYPADGASLRVRSKRNPADADYLATCQPCREKKQKKAADVFVENHYGWLMSRRGEWEPKSQILARVQIWPE